MHLLIRWLLNAIALFLTVRALTLPWYIWG